MLGTMFEKQENAMYLSPMVDKIKMPLLPMLVKMLMIFWIILISFLRYRKALNLYCKSLSPEQSVQLKAGLMVMNSTVSMPLLKIKNLCLEISDPIQDVQEILSLLLNTHHVYME